MKTRNSDDGTVPRHLEDDALIAYLDGELSRSEQDWARSHLESCWGCRGRVNAAQSSIENFLCVRKESLLPTVLPPSGPAQEQFRRRLHQHASSSARQPSFLKRLRLLRATLHEYVTLLRSRTSSWASSPTGIRVAVGLVLMVVAAGLFLLLNRETPVSADELMRESRGAQARQLRSASKPVVHQRLRVARAGARGAAAGPIDLETWHDADSSLFRRDVTEAGEEHSGHGAVVRAGAVAKNAAPPPAPQTLTELDSALLANGMDPRQPLSPHSYDAWRKSLGNVQEQVERSRRWDGIEVLTLKTVPTGPVPTGRIVEARFVVRERDWHPLEEHLRISREGGEVEYGLTELSYEVVELTSLGPAVFGEQTPASVLAAAPRAGAAPSPAPSGARDPYSVSAPTPGRAPAPADLEIEVLRLLNQAGANLGEQVSVTRTPEGQLYVRGIVETDQRKAEILLALQPVVNHPAVLVKINTVAEVQRAGGQTSARTTIQGGSIAEGATIPAYPQLRNYLTARGVAEDQIDENVRQLSANVLTRSRAVLRHAWALRNLSARFTQADMNGLSPEARDKWLGMVGQHAQAVQQGTRQLRHELTSIFQGGAAPAGRPAGIGEGGPDLMNALAALVELCSRNDQTVREAFTVSSTSAALTSIQTPQFWQELGRAEELAAKIQGVAQRLKSGSAR